MLNQQDNNIKKSNLIDYKATLKIYVQKNQVQETADVCATDDADVLFQFPSEWRWENADHYGKRQKYAFLPSLQPETY